MAKKKTSAATEAIERIEERVEQSQVDMSIFWDTATPLLKDWRKRIVSAHADVGESLTQGDETPDAWASVYKALRSYDKSLSNESRALLYYLWRLSWEFPGIASNIQDYIAKQFDITGKTGQVPVSLQKKLNAQRYRPLCIAESFLQGVPVSRDTTVGTLYSNLQRHGYTEDTESIDAFVVSHWSDGERQLKHMTNVTDMIKLWESFHGKPSDADKKKTVANAEDRHDRWVRQIAHGQKTLKELASASMKAEDKDRVRTDALNRLSDMHGVGIIKASSALYAIASLMPKTDYDKDGSPVVSFPIENASPEHIDMAIESARRVLDALEKAKAEKDYALKKSVVDQAMDVIKAMPKDQRDKLLAEVNGK